MLMLMTGFLSIVTLASFTGRDETLKTRTYRGEAVNPREQTAIYAEEHEEVYTSGERTQLLTTYRDATGKAIANRSVDFSSDKFAPTFRLEDLRTGYLEGAEVVPNGIRLYWRKSSNDPIQEKIANIPSPAVIDAGFNNFVQAHWDSVMTGEKLQMYFGVPFTLDYYRFRLYKDEEVTLNGRNAVVVKCDIDNFILRLFVKPIVLTYDIETRRMMSYEGISNINDDNGKSHFVRILYNPFGP